MNFDEWWNEDYDDKDNPFEKDSFGYWAYAGWCAAMQVEDPVAWVQKNHLQKAIKAPFMCRVEPTQRLADFIPIYTSPPIREWVGLTDEEIAEAVGNPLDEVYLADFRKVIAKVKEKNSD